MKTILFFVGAYVAIYIWMSICVAGVSYMVHGNTNHGLPWLRFIIVAVVVYLLRNQIRDLAQE